MAEQQRQLSESPRRLSRPQRLAAAGVIICVLSGAVSLLNAHSWLAGGVTVIWLSNGFLLGVVLCTPRREWFSYFLLGFFLDAILNFLLAHLFLGATYITVTSFWSALYLSGCNMLEVFLAAHLLYPSINPDPDLTRPRQLIRLLLYGVFLSTGIASFMATLITNGEVGIPNIHSLRYWFIADAIGIATVTPLYLSFYRRKTFAGRSMLEIAGLFLLLCVAIFVVFWQSQLPLLFLIFPFLLFIGLRLRLAGSALGLLIVSILGGYLTVSGHGPAALLHTSLTSRIVFFQLFIAITMLTLYIMEVTTAQSYRLQMRLQASETRFRLLAEVSSDIIILSNLKSERQYVSPAATEVLGWSPAELVNRSFREIVHADDMELVSQTVQDCLDGLHTDGMVYRCRKKDGEYLWVEANTRLFRDPNSGRAAGFVTLVRDFSRRKAAEDQLHQAFREAENLASVDSLTGIANRRIFDEILELEWGRSIRSHSPLGLLLFDVDHFKEFNDIYGHLDGDACLRRIVAATAANLHRSNDLFARYGGEEFVIILPHTDTAGALQIAEQIRRAVEQCGIPHSGSTHRAATISIGCASRTAGIDRSFNSLIAAADSALYRAKSNGRNRVETAPAE